MNRTWKKIAALAAAAALGVPASAELTTGRIGNIFTTGDEVRFHCTDAGTPAPEFEVRNWRQETVRSGTLSAEIRLHGLPPGYYTIGAGTEWTPFAVVADPAELRRTTEGFYGIDSALSWIGCGAPEAGKNMFAGGADLARLLGVSIVRDRLGWNDTQPGPDGKTDWKQFLACARLLRERGLEVLTVFHDAPSAMRRRNRTLPDDLREVYAYARSLAAGLGPELNALEFWNEQNADWFCHDPVWELAAAHKAAALGIRSVRPQLAVITGGLTEWFPKPVRYFERFLANGTYAYFDAAAFHLYGPLSSYPEFVSGLNAAYAARKLAPKPLWITESGTHCEGYGQVDPVFQRGKAYPFEVNEAFFDRREHSFAQNRLLAEFTVKSAVVMQSLGIARNFPFVLLPYNERGNRKVWGMMTWDYRVTPQFAAYANLCAQLGNLRCLGRLETPPEVAAYLYGDDAGSQTVVYWLRSGTVDEHALWHQYTVEELEAYDRSAATAEFTLTLPGQAKELRQTDLMGAVTRLPGGTELRLAAERFPRYLSGVRGLRPAIPAPAVPRNAAPDAASDTSIVLQLTPDDNRRITDQQSMTLELPAAFRLSVYKLGEREQTGTLSVNEEITVSGLPGTVTVPPVGRVQLEILVTAFHGSAAHGELRFGGSFGGRPIPPLTAFALFPARLAELFRPVPVDPGNGSRWVPESSGTFTRKEDGGFRVDFTGCGDDKWVYPMLPLTGEERANGELAAIAFSVRAEQREGSGYNNAFAVLQDSGGTKSFLPIPNPTAEWRRIYVLPADLPDALRGDALRPERLSIGFNPGSRFLDYQIRDLVLYYRK